METTFSSQKRSKVKCVFGTSKNIAIPYKNKPLAFRFAKDLSLMVADHRQTSKNCLKCPEDLIIHKDIDSAELLTFCHNCRT